MFLFFQSSNNWLAPFLFITPFSLLLAMKGLEIIFRRKSFVPAIFVGTVLVMALGVAAFFIFIEKTPVPYWLFNFSLPFGAGTFFIFAEYPENSIFVRALAFIIGILCNACAIGCLIEFGKKAYRLNKEINKFSGNKTTEEI